MSAKDDSVQIAVRMRPFGDREIALNTAKCVTMQGQMCTVAHPDGGEDKSFSFNYCYDSFDMQTENYATQEQVYNDVGKNLLENAFEGYNCCIFAYGQTGSGKSHTMTGPPNDKSPEQRGIIPRVLEELFTRINCGDNGDITYRVEVAFLEIYMENIRDLFNPKQSVPSLKVRESPTLGIYVEDLKKERVVSYTDVAQLMDLGNKIRTVAQTNMNATSSRSHSVFTVTLTQTKVDRESMTASDITSKINLIDLAGSERQTKTGASGSRLKEGSAINQSLSALGNVIEALADNATLKKVRLVPYRDSKLTRILQESLGGNSKTVMVAAISPATDNYAETISTLRYAARASKIQNVAVINENPNEKAIRELRAEVERLRGLLEGKDPGESEDVGAELAALRAELAARDRHIEELLLSQKERDAIAVDSDRSTLLSALETTGLAVRADRSKAHFLNLNEDPGQSESLIYYLKDDASTVFGSASEVDVCIGGVFVQPKHCVVSQMDGTVTLTPEEGATVFVRGIQVTEPVLLAHRDCVVLGNNHFFRYHDPVAAAQIRDEQGERAVTAEKPDIHDYHFALRELAALNPRELGPLRTKCEGLDELEGVLIKLYRQTTEASAIAQALGKQVFFEPNVARDYSGGLSNARPVVVVEVTPLNVPKQSFVPPGTISHDRFISLLHQMKAAYVNFTEFQKTTLPDPFDCVPQNVKIGVSHVLLLGLLDGVPIQEMVTPVLNARGRELGVLVVSLVPVLPAGIDWDVWGKAGSCVAFEVCFHEVRGLPPPLTSDVWCSLLFGGVLVQSPPLRGAPASTRVAFAQTVTIPRLDATMVSFFENGNICIEVFCSHPACA